MSELAGHLRIGVAMLYIIMKKKNMEVLEAHGRSVSQIGNTV